MFAVLQRVQQSEILVNKISIAKIAEGILVFIGIEKTDSQLQADKLIHKLLNYRIFPDQDDKMNLSLKDIQGDLLLVPQFTLAANTHKGLRPSFSSCEIPELASQKFSSLVEQAKLQYSKVEKGEFGADMKISLINDGPVTFTFHIN